MKVLYGCSELGLGHASRTIAFGKRLEKQGHELFLFAGGRAYQVLKENFKNVYYSCPVAWYENAGGIITSASLINILFPLPYYDGDEKRFALKSSSAMQTIHRYYDLRKEIKKIKPDLLIADGDLNALRMAHRWKIPAVYITNLIRPSYGFSSFLSPGERFTERYVKNCKKIIIPDNPPPHTVCEYNLGDIDSVGIAEKTEFVGSFFDTKPETGSENHIFAPISGPYGTRSKIQQIILPILQEQMSDFIVSLGVPDKPKSAKVKNCEVYTWLSSDKRKEYMRNAKLVIFSGGHITCFQTIKYGKPSICIPTQPEQAANAAKLQDLKCSIKVTNRSQLKTALKEIKDNYDRYKKKIRELSLISSKRDGLKRATEIVESVKTR